MKHYKDLVKCIKASPLCFIVNYYADKKMLESLIKEQAKNIDKENIITLFNICNVNEIKASIGNITVLYYYGYIDDQTLFTLCDAIDTLYKAYLSLPVLKVADKNALEKKDLKKLYKYEKSILHTLYMQRQKIHDFYALTAEAGNLVYSVTGTDTGSPSDFSYEKATPVIFKKNALSYYKSLTKKGRISLPTLVKYTLTSNHRLERKVEDVVKKNISALMSFASESKQNEAQDSLLSLSDTRAMNLKMVESCPSEFGLYAGYLRDAAITRIGQQMTYEVEPWTQKLRDDMLLMAECDFLVYLCEVAANSTEKETFRKFMKQKTTLYYSKIESFLKANPTFASEKDYTRLQGYIETLSSGIRVGRKERRHKV